MDQANKDGSGDALVNFLRGAWIDFIDSNLTIEKVGGQPSILDDGTDDEDRPDMERMMVKAILKLPKKDDNEIIKKLDKFSKIEISRSVSD